MDDFKNRLLQGLAPFNGWLHLPDSIAAEVMSRAGWDSLTVDMQHGLMGYDTALAMLQAISTTDTPALVRVPANDPALIMRMLDAGALGVVCPLVNSAAEARQLVAACRYPPQGVRSNGPVRAALRYGADYTPRANAAVLTLAMVETREGFEALEDILQTPGLDGVYVGPSDLSFSYRGFPELDHRQGEMRDKIQHIANRAHAHGKLAGIYCGSPAYALEALGMGFHLTSVQSDLRFLQMGAQAALQQLRGHANKQEGC